MSKCECNSGDYMQMLEEIFERNPHYRECSCGNDACMACNFYRSKGAVVDLALERTVGIGAFPIISRSKFNELYDYAVQLEKELAELRNGEPNLFLIGNVLRGTFRYGEGLHIMICDDFTGGDNKFLGTVLVDFYNRYKPGEVKTFNANVSDWRMSSFQEVASEKA